MGILQNLWLLITFSISAIILITDPKEPIANSGTNPVSGLFSSSSKGQKFITNFNWFLIALFFILTICLNYLAV